MNHIGLFEGIGGFSLAARWMGWDTIAWCEWDKDCQRVLKHHFPNAKSHGDIKSTDFTIYRGQCDVLTGGFPCQPYSTAGKRLGKADDRHLWPEMLRAIREIAPRYVVGENVRGLVNWNGGVVFDEVQADLEACGYEVIPFLLPACAVNAPHRRDRIWFVAYANDNGPNGSKNRQSNREGNDLHTSRENATVESSRCGNTTAGKTSENPISNGRIQQEFEQERTENGQLRDIGTGDSIGLCGKEVAGLDTDTSSERLEGRERGAPKGTGFVFSNWQDFPTQSPVCSGDDGFPGGLVDITFSKWRQTTIKQLGNAIVPQVAYQIFKAIEQSDM